METIVKIVLLVIVMLIGFHTGKALAMYYFNWRDKRIK